MNEKEFQTFEDNYKEANELKDELADITTTLDRFLNEKDSCIGRRLSEVGYIYGHLCQILLTEDFHGDIVAALHNRQKKLAKRFESLKT